MAREIDILVVEPGRAPRPARAEDTLESFQRIVGGPIEAGCYLPQRVMLVRNGGDNDLPDRAGAAPDRGSIAGTFLLCSFKGGRFASLPPDRQREFSAYFALPGPKGGGEE